MKITLKNDFHNTEITLIAKNGMLSTGQVKKSKKTLCGIAGCTCGDELGTRGNQDLPEGMEVIPRQDRDGQIWAKVNI